MLLTVATAGVADTHGVEAAAVPEPVSWVVDPGHTLNVPDIVGKGFIVIVVVARGEFIIPFPSVTVSV